MIPRFAEALSLSRRPIIYGDGSQTRDFTHVSNAVHANLLAGASRHELSSEVLNIAAGESRSVLGLLEAMAALLGVSAEADMQPARAGDVLHSAASVQAAQRVLNYTPITSFEQGLEGTVKHYAQLFSGQTA